ncbi:MAG: phosphoserine phosphatase SerB, partial [Pseudomonadota bacterium]|nr:phosphoserine phosphatase SerB [Pseudomonadota bacterium]
MTKEFLVLTAPPGAGVLTADLVSRIADILAGATSPKVLGDAEAVECGLSETNETSEQDMENAVRQCLGSAPVDINIVAAAERRKQLLVADMESTIIEQECLDELAVEFGVQEKMVDITARAMRGELDFEPSLRERVAMLTGLPVSVLQTLYDNRISLMPGAATLLATLNANATTCGLVSGGFRFFAEKIADRLGFDRFQSNDLGIADNKLDGTVTDPILGRAAKADIMRDWSKELGISPAQVLAVGDG